MSVTMSTGAPDGAGRVCVCGHREAMCSTFHVVPSQVDGGIPDDVELCVGVEDQVQALHQCIESMCQSSELQLSAQVNFAESTLQPNLALAAALAQGAHQDPLHVLLDLAGQAHLLARLGVHGKRCLCKRTS